MSPVKFLETKTVFCQVVHKFISAVKLDFLALESMDIDSLLEPLVGSRGTAVFIPLGFVCFLKPWILGSSVKMSVCWDYSKKIRYTLLGPFRIHSFLEGFCVF